MARIGDTVRPELGRADTSGILRGAMQGASALGQGIAALGAGVGAGVKERKQNEKEVTATISRLDSLKKSVPEKSPLSAMLQHGIDTLSDPDLSPRKAAAMAAGFNQGIDDHWTKTEMELKQAAEARDADVHGITRPVLVAEAGMRAALPPAKVAALSDMREFAGDPEGLTRRIGDRMQAMTDPESWQQKQAAEQSLLQEFESPEGIIMAPSRIDEAMELQREPAPLVPIIPSEIQQVQPSTDLGGGPGGVLPPKQPTGPTGQMRAAAYLSEIEAATAGSGGAVTFDEYEDVDPKTGEVVKRQVMKVDGRIAQLLPTVPKGKMFPSASEAGQAEAMKLRYKSAEERNQFVVKMAAESREARVKIQQGLELLADPKVYTGKFAPFKQWVLSTANAFGIDSSELAKMERLDVLLGDFVMARVAQTKGAISEKEMALFERWAAGATKTKEANMDILRALKKVEDRRIVLSQKARELRQGGLTDSVELDDALQLWMDNKMPAFDDADFEPGGTGPAARGSSEQASVALGDALAAARKGLQQPSPQPSAQPAAQANPLTPPLPQAAPPNAPAGTRMNNPLWLKSPHTGRPISLEGIRVKRRAQSADALRGLALEDPTAPGKFFSIP